MTTVSSVCIKNTVCNYRKHISATKSIKKVFFNFNSCKQFRISPFVHKLWSTDSLLSNSNMFCNSKSNFSFNKTSRYSHLLCYFFPRRSGSQPKHPAWCTCVCRTLVIHLSPPRRADQLRALALSSQAPCFLDSVATYTEHRRGVTSQPPSSLCLSTDNNRASCSFPATHTGKYYYVASGPASQYS